MGTLTNFVGLGGDQVAMREFVSGSALFPHLVGIRPDLYRCFIEQTWKNSSARGIVTLLHPEKHFTDENGGDLRRACYRRLRRHWHFVNELRLFEIKDNKHYGVHVYGRPRGTVRFVQASWLYHPDTVERSFQHSGDGQEPGLKDLDGRWDVRPHRSRLETVDYDLLATWHDMLENDHVPVQATRMIYGVNTSVVSAMRRTRQCGARWVDLGCASRRDGMKLPTSIRDSLKSSGAWRPHGSALFFKVRTYSRRTHSTRLRTSRCCTIRIGLEIDLESLSVNALPVTSLQASRGFGKV